MNDQTSKKSVLIIGAGPAGLTAALELLRNTNIKPIVLEMSDYMGGISRTVNFKGNRIDIGGHRFFSKSNRVMSWWLDIMPLAPTCDLNMKELEIFYQNQSRTLNIPENPPDPDKEDNVMLVRERLSRIYYLRKFFNYPINLSLKTILNLGLIRMVKIGFSYAWAMAFQIKPEKNLEDFFINRFGNELYRTFFKDYTEKVWGVNCTDITPDWGRQRIKGLSISRAILHALKSLFGRKIGGIYQKNVETSLIERFMYPKLGPGQMWDNVAGMIREKGGEVNVFQKVASLNLKDGTVVSAQVENIKNSETYIIEADYFISTMPIRELINSMDGIDIPKDVQDVANGLLYRDFITVGLLLDKLKIKDNSNPRDLVADNWIYIQEHDVKVGRLQIFNNWSPYMVADESKVWIGMEYFCNEDDELWSMDDETFAKFAVKELVKIDIIQEEDLVDHIVIRMPKAYPGYFGTYDRFDTIRDFLDPIENLFLIGRNGMHRYNNQDHSMLAAMAAVENIAAGRTDKDNIWNVNTEHEYHESKSKDEST